MTLHEDIGIGFEDNDINLFSNHDLAIELLNKPFVHVILSVREGDHVLAFLLVIPLVHKAFDSEVILLLLVDWFVCSFCS
jgi:hypothetical protein